MVVVPPGAPGRPDRAPGERLQAAGAALQNTGKQVTSFVWSVIVLIVIGFIAYSIFFSDDSGDSVDSGGSGRSVSRSEFGQDWPLTVESGTVECLPLSPSLGSVIFTDDGGTTYAVNGTARDHTDFPDIHPIWADAPFGAKVDISPIIDAGLSLCDA